MKTFKYNKPDLEEAVKNSYTYAQVFRYLKLCSTNYKFLKQKLQQFNIDVDHFHNAKERGKIYGGKKIKKSLNDLLIKNYKGSICYSNLKQRLYKEGLKIPICEICGQNEIWRGQKISLILDHVDGDHYNNEIINLRILCPNCNAAQPTHCGKNKKKSIDNGIKKPSEYQLKIENNIKIIKEANIQWKERKWRTEVAKLIGGTTQRSGRFILENFPEIWEICYKHKDNINIK